MFSHCVDDHQLRQLEADWGRVSIVGANLVFSHCVDDHQLRQLEADWGRVSIVGG